MSIFWLKTMKKNLITLTLIIAALTISSCGLSKPSSESSAFPSSFSEESSTSSSVDASTSEESSLISSSSSESSSISSESTTSISSSSSSEPSSSSSSSFSSSSESSISSAESSASSSSSSSSSVSSSSSSSQSSANSSENSSNPNQELTPKYAASTYKDLFNNSSYVLSTTPSVGEANILVIPVWFTDSSTYISTSSKENVREDIHAAYFGTNEETGWRSVKTYYEEESHGALTLTGTVSDWYECGKSSSNYRVDDDLSKTIGLVKTATEWYFKQNAANRTDYDCDKDGYLDGVMLIYAAPDLQASGNDNYDNLWAYCYWVQERSAKSVMNPGANAFFWASYDFMYGQEIASARTGKSNSPFHGDTSHCNIDAHTFIHEMGHMFGLNDYYDYSGKYSPAAGFSMQDSNVGGHDPFSSFALGWGQAYVPTETITINLKPFAETGEMILLSPSFNQYDSPFDEYLLLEYYTPTGLNAFDTQYQYSSNLYPKGVQTSGIRLWHVDDRLYYETRNSFSFTTNPKDNSHTVEEAFTNTYSDGTEETEAYCSPLGSDYYNFNQLQLIHNSTRTTYKPMADLSSSSLFKAGNSFDMNTYKKQFVKSGKLNQNIDLGFTFTIDSVTAEYATITITKL